MGGMITRFRNAFQVQAHQAAERLEDPHRSLDYSLAKLEANRSELTRGLVEVSAAKKRLEGQRAGLEDNIKKYDQQAEALLKIEREDLVRRVLIRKHDSQTLLSGLVLNIATLESQLQDLKHALSLLDRKIDLFRTKKEELKSLYDSSQAQFHIRQSLAGISGDLADVGRVIQRVEERILALQSRTSAIDDLVSQGVLTDSLDLGMDEVDRELARTEREARIEAELARLKASSPAELPSAGAGAG